MSHGTRYAFEPRPLVLLSLSSSLLLLQLLWPDADADADADSLLPAPVASPCRDAGAHHESQRKREAFPSRPAVGPHTGTNVGSSLVGCPAMGFSPFSPPDLVPAQSPCPRHLPSFALSPPGSQVELMANPSLPPACAQFLAGQWLDVHVPGVAQAGGFTITSPPSRAASASLSSSPGRPYLELAVQAAPGSAPAAWLWRSEAEIVGATLRVRVGGRFVLPPPGRTLADVRRVVLVAGGVGVNPLVSMLAALAEDEARQRRRPADDVVVLYGSKLPRSGRLDDVLFLSRLAGLVESSSPSSVAAPGKVRGRLRLYATGEMAKPGPVDGCHEIAPGLRVDVRRGRLRAEELVELVREGDEAGESFVYVCGPPAMTDAFTVALTNAGMAEDRVKREKWW